MAENKYLKYNDILKDFLFKNTKRKRYMLQLVINRLIFCFVLFCFVCLFVLDRVSLYSSGCPGTHSVDQAGFKL